MAEIITSGGDVSMQETNYQNVSEATACDSSLSREVNLATDLGISDEGFHHATDTELMIVAPQRRGENEKGIIDPGNKTSPISGENSLHLDASRQISEIFGPSIDCVRTHEEDDASTNSPLHCIKINQVKDARSKDTTTSSWEEFSTKMIDSSIMDSGIDQKEKDKCAQEKSLIDEMCPLSAVEEAVAEILNEFANLPDQNGSFPVMNKPIQNFEPNFGSKNIEKKSDIRYSTMLEQENVSSVVQPSTFVSKNFHSPESFLKCDSDNENLIKGFPFQFLHGNMENGNLNIKKSDLSAAPSLTQVSTEEEKCKGDYYQRDDPFQFLNGNIQNGNLNIKKSDSSADLSLTQVSAKEEKPEGDDYQRNDSFKPFFENDKNDNLSITKYDVDEILSVTQVSTKEEKCEGVDYQKDGPFHFLNGNIVNDNLNIKNYDSSEAPSMSQVSPKEFKCEGYDYHRDHIITNQDHPYANLKGAEQTGKAGDDKDLFFPKPSLASYNHIAEKIIIIEDAKKEDKVNDLLKNNIVLPEKNIYADKDLQKHGRSEVSVSNTDLSPSKRQEPRGDRSNDSWPKLYSSGKPIMYLGEPKYIGVEKEQPSLIVTFSKGHPRSLESSFEHEEEGYFGWQDREPSTAARVITADIGKVPPADDITCATIPLLNSGDELQMLPRKKKEDSFWKAMRAICFC